MLSHHEGVNDGGEARRTDRLAAVRTDRGEDSSGNADLKFELGSVEFELTVAVEKEAKPGAKVKFWSLRPVPTLAPRRPPPRRSSSCSTHAGRVSPTSSP
ncbi:trypco2 family protein [Kibdelosporangium banguiense]|uniref:trypco2 family protein n=1 Tax=Kibdelosporangium banguiense TaxID=1365924 RepID=UPI0035576D36